jgi:hypothetical protein
MRGKGTGSDYPEFGLQGVWSRPEVQAEPIGAS